MSEQKSQKKDSYTSVVIGAGRIGAGFDAPGDEHILTHAHAHQLHRKVDLRGFFDIEREAADGAAEKWGGKGYDNLDVMLSEIRPDIVTICSPDVAHVENLKVVAKYEPKIVICEKPITTAAEDTQNIIDLYKEKNIPLTVNYTRRFDTFLQEFKKNYENGEYGEIMYASGTYTKGLLHNGSHIIDTARLLFGEYLSGHNMHEISDFSETDKTVGGFLSFEKCPQFYLIAGDSRKFFMFEMDIVFEKARFRFPNEGFDVSEQRVIPDPIFEGYECLGREKHMRSGLSRAMSCLIENAVEHIEDGTPLLCTAEDALKVQKICLSLLKK